MIYINTEIFNYASAGVTCGSFLLSAHSSRIDGRKLTITYMELLMEMSLTEQFKHFELVYNNVKKSMGITDQMLLDHNKLAYITLRAQIIYKLDNLLFVYKQKNDPHRIVLHGRNALNSYLSSKYKVPYSEAKSLSLMEILIILMPELNEMKLPADVLEHLSKCSDFVFHLESVIPEAKRKIIEDHEWDPELFDRRFLK